LKDEVTPKNIGNFMLGMGTSVGTHVVGHHLAGEIFDMNIEMRGMNELVVDELDHPNSELRWFGRSGFILQLGINTFLTSFEKTKHSYFTKGYTAASCTELLTYPVRRKSDGFNNFNYIDKYGGNGDRDMVIFTSVASYNFYKISFIDENEDDLLQDNIRDYKKEEILIQQISR
jgi:hypothetical protein